MLKKTTSSIFIWDAMFIQENIEKWFSKEKGYCLQSMFFGKMTVK